VICENFGHLFGHLFGLILLQLYSLSAKGRREGWMDPNTASVVLKELRERYYRWGGEPTAGDVLALRGSM
jgi:hypothetical protein